MDMCESNKESCVSGCQRTGKRLEQNDIQAECVRLPGGPECIPCACNARIQEEELHEFDPQTMAYYECTFTVETPESMEGEYWVTLEVEDAGGRVVVT